MQKIENGYEGNTYMAEHLVHTIEHAAKMNLGALDNSILYGFYFLNQHP